MSKKFLNISLLLSALSVTLTVVINLQIAKEYERVDGKTRLFFGIKEMYQFTYQYFVAIMGVVALWIAVSEIKSGSPKLRIITAALFSIIAITLVFVRIWRVFVPVI